MGVFPKIKVNIIFLVIISTLCLATFTTGCQSDNADNAANAANQSPKEQDKSTSQTNFLLANQRTIPIGAPIPVVEKRIHPDSISPPKIVPALPPKRIQAHQNRQVANKGIIYPIQPENLKIYLSEEDSLNFARPFELDVEKVPAIHNPSISASPPTFKDNAVYDIRQLDVDQGLNGSYQQTICETRAGYLWFGAWPGGICRYDGKSFLQFTEKEGLVYSEVNDILEDRDQNLWVATKQGFSKYDGFTFTNYTKEINFDIQRLFEDSKGNLWLATLEHGLLLYDGTHFIQFFGEDRRFTEGFFTILERDEQIWIGTSYGLLQYNGHSFTHFLEKDGLIDNRINDLFKDQNNDLWIATEGGVSQYNGASFINYIQTGSYIDDAIVTILEDKNGHIWLGTANNSLIRYDGDYFTQYSTQEGLSNNEITDVLEDSYGQLWISTYGGGVNRFNTTAAFEQVFKMPNLSNQITNALYEDRSKNIWITTEENGLFKYDGMTFSHFTEANGLITNEVNCITEDQNGHLWIGSGAGLGVLSKYDGKSFIHYDEKQGLPGGSVWNLLEDARENLWVSTSDGLSKFDGQSFTLFPQDSGLLDQDISEITADSKGNIWLATGLALTKYDGDFFTHFTTQEGLIDNSVMSVKEDSRGYLWIGTFQGLSVFDGAQFYSFTKEQGLENEKIWTFDEDHLGNIWLGTKKGIFLLEIPPSATQNFADLQATKIQGFHKMDALKAEDIRIGGIWVHSDHQLFASTGKGLMSLDLDQFYAQRNQHIPILHWNTLQINEQYIDFTNSTPSDLTNQFGNIYFASGNAFNSYPTDLEVAYDLNHFTFDFIAFDWAAPHYIRYQYQLEGLENKWSQLTAANKVDYRSIPPGNYTFKVKAAGQANIWSDPIVYSFTVLPPWWLTTWAYLAYFLLLAALLYAIFSFFKNRLILENELKIEQQEARRLQELDSFKSRLFTNLTHEFRTPLTVILGMNGQIRAAPEKYLKKGTDLIENNGKNLLRLINQLLDLSKLENKAFDLQMRQSDIIPYLTYITESFQSYADNKDLSLEVSTTTPTLVMDYDAEQIKQVLSNLISNAIKFTPANGQICVNLSTESQQLIIEVKDNGIGISAENLLHIFDRFYQVPDISNFSGEGTGIGLAYAQESVELMGGQISVTSTIHQGTSFQICLPIHHQAIVENKILNKNTSLNWNIPTVPVTEPNEVISQKHADLPELLLVEDNPDVMTYLTSCLEGLYQLHLAQNGKIGIEKALEHIPDVIISDVMMPEKNGYELCDFLKNDERSSHIPIILLTAKADVSSKMEGLKRGADVYLSKPFDKTELLLRLEKITQRQKRLKNYFSKSIKNEVIVVSENLEKEEQEVIQIEHVFIEKVKSIIAENYSQEQFSLIQLCEILNMSRSQLYRKMKALIDVSPSQFIRSYRLQQGKILLETTDLSIAEVAWQSGFKERSHFSKAFNDEFGFYPTSFNK